MKRKRDAGFSKNYAAANRPAGGSFSGNARDALLSFLRPLLSLARPPAPPLA